MTAYTAICEREDDWWVVTVPELESGRVTQARTLDEVPETVADLVATMTGVDPTTVLVRVEADADAVPMPGERSDLDTRPAVVRDNWNDDNVRALWGLRVSDAQKLVLIEAYLEGQDSRGTGRSA